MTQSVKYLSAARGVAVVDHLVRGDATHRLGAQPSKLVLAQRLTDAWLSTFTRP
ncbi:hypothetical protein ACPXB3_00315 [Gordonia sp. DT219]|uniref:hypothetical protein n=1 Tax=Gordonia sp. DT219 TaxID=3416658 RepID=UPI003CEBA323